MTPFSNSSEDAYPEDTRRFLDEFKTRHSANSVIAALAAARKLRVLVVGEAILDEYCYCAPLGKSPKEAIVSTKHLWSECHAGGALACANHAAGFCDNVDLITCLGDADAREAFVRDHLRPNVRPQFFFRPGAPTIVKRRYIWEPFLVRMFEVDFMDDTPLPQPVEDQMLAHLSAALPEYDVVIVADYGHGLIGRRAVAALMEGARFLAVNAQANAGNLGFNLVTKYSGADYVCLDEPELRLAAQDRWGAVAELAEKVRSPMGGPAITVTRGAKGAFSIGKDGAKYEFPVLSSRVVDRMGAGDAYLSVTALCIASGVPMEMVGLIGGIVGGLAVGIVGNRSAIDPTAVARFATGILT